MEMATEDLLEGCECQLLHILEDNRAELQHDNSRLRSDWQEVSKWWHAAMAQVDNEMYTSDYVEVEFGISGAESIYFLEWSLVCV